MENRSIISDDIKLLDGLVIRENLERMSLNLHKLYNERVLRPTNIIDLTLQRVKQTSELNSFITVTSDVANNGAFKSEKKIISNRKMSALEGIPIAIKDNFCTKDIPTTCASKMLKNFIPTYDATVFSRLIKAGACLIGKTNLDEFAMGSGSVDSIFGPTRNPWTLNGHDWRISGGSSGGSAVAVATGSCVASIGSDTGGSTRNPAALCGIFGLKPTYGLVSRYGLIPLVNSMDVPGVMARNVDDLCIVLNCIAGPDNMDSTNLKYKYKPVEIQNDFNLSNIRVGIPKEYNCEGMSDEVVEVWKEIADFLENQKCKVISVSLPHTSVSIAVYSILNQCEISSNMARYDGIGYGLRSGSENSIEELYASTRSEGFNNVVRSRIFSGNYFLLTRNYEKYFLKALKLRRLIANDFKNVFNGENKVDILLTPTTLSEAPLYENFVSIHNRDQCVQQDYCTQPANLAGIPALSIPIRLSNNKLPLSLQLMGPMMSEELLINVAKKIESFVKFPRLYLIKNKAM